MIGQLLLLFGVFNGAATLSVPVFLVAALSTIVYSVVYPAMPPVVLVQNSMQGLDQPIFTAIPFVFLVGAIMNAGGITARLIRLAWALLGQFRGVLSHAMVGGFATISEIGAVAVAYAVVGPGIQLILNVPMLVPTLVASGLDTLEQRFARVASIMRVRTLRTVQILGIDSRKIQEPNVRCSRCSRLIYLIESRSESLTARGR